jgi:hypothetical protein
MKHKHARPILFCSVFSPALPPQSSSSRALTSPLAAGRRLKKLRACAAVSQWSPLPTTADARRCSLAGVVELAEDGEEEEQGTPSGVGERSMCPGGPSVGGRSWRLCYTVPSASDTSSSPCTHPSFFSHGGERRGQVEAHPESRMKLWCAAEAKRRTQWRRRRAPCPAGSVRNPSRLELLLPRLALTRGTGGRRREETQLHGWTGDNGKELK